MALCVLALLGWILPGRSEVIDRIVAIVDGHIITLSDLRQERDARARLGETPIDDDVLLARQLVDTFLIEQQIADYPNILVASEEVDAELQRLKANSGAVADSLRDAVRRRIRTQKFFDVKFRESVKPTDEEIRKYYEEVFVPEARKRGLASVPPLTDAAMLAAVRDNVIQESLDHDVEVWLEGIRRRSSVEVFQ